MTACGCPHAGASGKGRSFGFPVFLPFLLPVPLLLMARTPPARSDKAGVRYWAECQDEVTHITQCAQDGHSGHHAWCCTSPLPPEL